MDQGIAQIGRSLGDVCDGQKKEAHKAVGQPNAKQGDATNQVHYQGLGIPLRSLLAAPVVPQCQSTQETTDDD